MLNHTSRDLSQHRWALSIFISYIFEVKVKVKMLLVFFFHQKLNSAIPWCNFCILYFVDILDHMKLIEDDKNFSIIFFTDFIISYGLNSMLWYQFKVLDKKHSLTARLILYKKKNKNMYHRNISHRKIKLFKSQKIYFNMNRVFGG